jgi:hypothetical protein
MDQPNARGGPIPSTTSNTTKTNNTIGDRVVDFEELEETLNVKKVPSGRFKGRKISDKKDLTRNTNTNASKRLGGGR